MEGLMSKDHFEGGKHVQNDGGTGKDLASFLRAIQNDLVAILGIKGVQTITVASATTIASADATNLATLLTLVNETKESYNEVAALANDVYDRLVPVQEVDIVAAKASLVTLLNASDLATAVALANDIKAKYNASVALLNELKGDLNTEATVTIVAADSAVTAVANATNEATAITLTNDLKAKINVAVTLINEIKSDLNAAPKTALANLALILE